MEVNKVYNMDALEFLKGIEDNSIDLVLVDPPYNISQKNISRKNLSFKGYKRNMDIKQDFGDWDHFKSDEEFLTFTENWFKECARILKPKSWIYIFFDKQKIGYFDLILAEKYGIKVRNIYIWLKSNPVPSFRKMNWLSANEFIWVGSKGEGKIKNFLSQKQMYNYMITPNKSIYGETIHPTEKPKKLIRRLIEASTIENDIVLDCFMGSGTTAICAKELNRNFIGCEINKEYYQLCLDRLKQNNLY